VNARRVFWLVLFIAVIMAACQPAEDASGPPEIRYGEDVCDRCNMLIAEPRFATAYGTTESEVRRFDDIGCLFLHAQEEAESVASYWVHDFDSEEWIAAEEATFVHNPDLVTPMGWGVAAFAAAEDAESYQADGGGSLLTFGELQAQIESGELNPMSMGMKGHDH
jgi:copper chaperone NosL